MKILIVNELLISGGAEQSCLKMKKLLKQHNDVVYLNFDNEFEEKLKEVDDKENIINIKLGNKKINKYIFNWFLYRKIRKKIKEINPDKIILNNLVSSPISQMNAMKGYDVYQIIRDYYAVCPKATCIKNDNSICKGYKNCNCYKTCDGRLKMHVRLYQIKRMERLRKRIVKKVISPSKMLDEYLMNFGYNSCSINNPVEITKESEQNSFNNLERVKKYIYLGSINEIKGIYKFIDVYNIFSKDKDVKLVIVGKCSNIKDEEIMNEYVKNNSKIEFLGYKSHADVLNLLKDFHFIVVPSLWIENYPTTAIEGMLYGTVVIGSDRGGIPEIVGKDRGFLFDIINKDSILQVLEKTYTLDNETYCEMRKKANEYVKYNNSFEIYYKKIMQVLEEY